MAERRLGYCTNVHAGADLAQTLANLEQYAAGVQRKLDPDRPLDIGLWLSARTVQDLKSRYDYDRELFRPLSRLGLRVLTVNGFPYGDFHQPVVKHEVYRPDWSDPARATYTSTIAQILNGGIPPGEEVSISTLPLGWKADWSAAKTKAAVEHLLMTAELFDLEFCEVHLDLEPEPGCVLERSEDVVRFFTEHLFPAGDESMIRERIRVCHDVCHAAVMFEDQREMLRRYDDAGIRVGKVQLSSAVRARLDGQDAARRAKSLETLGSFREPKYLHQTMIRSDAGERFYEDLPEALSSAEPEGEWRVHFHVPVYADHLGAVGTTQAWIDECLELFADRPTSHFEIETYAWGQLPPGLVKSSLVDGIVKEMRWIRERAGPGYFA